MTPPEASDPVVADFEAFRRRANARIAQSRSGGPTGGGGDDLEQRVSALERSVGKMDGKLDKIIETQGAERLGNEQRFGSIAERLATIEGKIDSKAAAADVAKVVGRVESLPSTWQMITLVIGTVFTILGGSFLILKLGLPHGP